jgi:hypothetical protein
VSPQEVVKGCEIWWYYRPGLWYWNYQFRILRVIVIKVLYYLLADMRWCTIVWKQHFLICSQRNTLRYALFWDIMQHRTVILCWRFRINSWSHHQWTSSPSRLPGTLRYANTVPYMNSVSWVFLEFLDCLTLEDATDRLSCNMGTELPFYAAYHPRGAQISLMSQHKHEITCRMSCCRSGSSVWNSDTKFQSFVHSTVTSPVMWFPMIPRHHECNS